MNVPSDIHFHSLFIMYSCNEKYLGLQWVLREARIDWEMRLALRCTL